MTKSRALPVMHSHQEGVFRKGHMATESQLFPALVLLQTSTFHKSPDRTSLTAVRSAWGVRCPQVYLLCN